MDSKDAALAARIGAAVRRRREELGWRQAGLAERIGTSVEYVSMIERGTRMPSVPTLVALARELGASLDALTGQSEAEAEGQDALFALARSVPAPYRQIAARMLAGIAEPRSEYVPAPTRPRTKAG